MLPKRNHYIAISIVSCFIVMAVGSTNVLSQNQKSIRKYTDEELNTKFDRIRAAIKHFEELNRRGYMPRMYQAAKETVAIVEEEFGSSSFILIRPLLTLAKLQGEQKLFDEADRSFEKIYLILESGDDITIIYSVAYRIRIAQLYFDWNKFVKAESVLLKTQWNINTTMRNTDLFTQEANEYPIDYEKLNRSVTAELEKVRALIEINRFRIKKRNNAESN